jgi:hypothetical protein
MKCYGLRWNLEAYGCRLWIDLSWNGSKHNSDFLSERPAIRSEPIRYC